MTVSFKLKMGMTLFHAQTMKELRIDKVIEQSYNEDSQEYKELCKEYTQVIGFARELDKTYTGCCRRHCVPTRIVFS